VFFFLFFQYFEYGIANFTISDSIYGCCFFMATGFHGFHVFVGASFILASLYRMSLYHFTRDSHFGYEACIWYWHFVDVVWLFLYFFVYWWGGH
jgi:heme/copper-type cytochrome/quinol oxidase subunit 3